MRMLARYWIAFVAVFAIHNAEEVTHNLPAWAKAHGVFDPFPNRTTFMLAVIILTVSASIVGYVLEVRRSRRSAAVLQVFCGIMIVNAIWHLGISLYHSSVMPGAVSAFAMLPVFCWLVLKCASR